MPIQVTCNRCGARFEVPDSRAGTMGKCRCGNALKVPLPEASPAHTGIPQSFPQAGPPREDDLVPLGPPRAADSSAEPSQAMPGGGPALRRPAISSPRRRGKKEVIGSGHLVRYATYLSFVVIAAAIGWLLLSYPRWVAERIDGNWVTPGGAVLSFKSGKVLNPQKQLANGYFAYKGGAKWDEQFLFRKDVGRFSGYGGNGFILMPEGSIRMHLSFSDGPGGIKEATVTAKPIAANKLELTEKMGKTGSLLFLSGPLVVTRGK